MIIKKRKSEIGVPPKLPSYDIAEMTARTRERLSEIKREASLTDQEFIASCCRDGEPVPKHTTVASWRNGKSVPGGNYLRRIAYRFGVTTDWLLGFEDAPKYPNGEREIVDWQDDFAAYLRRAVGAKLKNQLSPKDIRKMKVNTEMILEDLVDDLSVKHALIWKAKEAYQTTKLAMLVSGQSKETISKNLKPLEEIIGVLNRLSAGDPLIPIKGLKTSR